MKAGRGTTLQRPSGVKSFFFLSGENVFGKKKFSGGSDFTRECSVCGSSRFAIRSSDESGSNRCFRRSRTFFRTFFRYVETLRTAINSDLIVMMSDTAKTSMDKK